MLKTVTCIHELNHYWIKVSATLIYAQSDLIHVFLCLQWLLTYEISNPQTYSYGLYCYYQYILYRCIQHIDLHIKYRLLSCVFFYMILFYIHRLHFFSEAEFYFVAFVKCASAILENWFILKFPMRIFHNYTLTYCFTYNGCITLKAFLPKTV